MGPDMDLTGAESYLDMTEPTQEDFHARIVEAVADDDVFDNNETIPSDKPIDDYYEPDTERFTMQCSFSPLRFRELYQPLAECPDRNRGDRIQIIGPIDLCSRVWWAIDVLL
jgi:hypothetical protein